MAYSQNTDQAWRCKRLLIKAFAEARHLLAESQTTEVNDIAIKLLKMLGTGELDRLIAHLQHLKARARPVTTGSVEGLLIESDRDHGHWAHFLRTWFTIYGDAWVTATHVARRIQSDHAEELSLSRVVPESV